MLSLRRYGRTLAAWILRLLTSERCFYVIVICFIIQALWLAFTARYPMAFDENFHFGLIQLHANQWLPFFTHQPPGADAYGAVTRDPSYLYHFLMSLPYRLIRLVTNSASAQVITLRVINIALFAYGFILIRRLLFRLGGSRPLAHTTLFLFSFMPIVPFLAAQINYDNLLVPLTAAIFLVVLTWTDELKHHRISFTRTALLLSMLLLGCLVKYAFLPVFAATVIFMFWQLWKYRLHWSAVRHAFVKSIKSSPKIRIVVVSILAALSVALFSQQYVVNLLQFHTPLPDCAQVLTIQRCASYSPWERNYTFTQQLPKNFKPNFPDYIWQWMYGMWQRSFFTISDTYMTMPPLPLIGGAAIVLAVTGSVLFLRYGRQILADSTYRQYGLVVLIIYTLTLFAYLYKSYTATGIEVAINGRYLVPFLPIIFLYAGLAFGRLLKKRQSLKALAVAVTVFCFLQGGGALAFIVQSDDTWDWPNSSVVHANDAARKVLHPITAGSRK
jgi:hypothetical protein